MAKKICGFTQQEAIKEILAAGWKPWYPIENVDLLHNGFWDGKDHTVGHAWGSAIKEILERRKPVQLPLFTRSQLISRRHQR